MELWKNVFSYFAFWNISCNLLLKLNNIVCLQIWKWYFRIYPQTCASKFWGKTSFDALIAKSIFVWGDISVISCCAGDRGVVASITATWLYSTSRYGVKKMKMKERKTAKRNKIEEAGAYQINPGSEFSWYKYFDII